MEAEESAEEAAPAAPPENPLADAFVGEEAAIETIERAVAATYVSSEARDVEKPIAPAATELRTVVAIFSMRSGGIACSLWPW